MPYRVYIDGHAGTTGLVINDLLADRGDIELLLLDESQRKLDSARRDAIDQADLSILCLPDDAARQAVGWAEASSTRIIDASTAHRVSSHWTYGLPEMDGNVRSEMQNSKYVANPGCYPTGVILMLRPLVEAGVVAADSPIAIHALSGYSGGGKQMISRWEDPNLEYQSLRYSAPYALSRLHKHIPEMVKFSKLEVEPQFLPRVGPFDRGMRTEIPLHKDFLKNSGTDPCKVITKILRERYANEQFVDVAESHESEPGEFAFDPRRCNGTNQVSISVVGHPSGHVTLVAILDNLGKGAAGAAVQSMNLMLGFDENKGLN